MSHDRSVLFQAGSVPEGYRKHLQPAIFEPWALRLIAYAELQPGQTVLDVASGTGVVARAAASRVGADGQVIASDISAGMLTHVSDGVDPAGAGVRTLECSAGELGLADASVDAVLCQQGLQFMPDRVAVAREMRRVLRAGGRTTLAVWLADAPLEPFATYARALEQAGLEEPFPEAYDVRKFAMAESEIEQVLLSAGFADVELSVEELEIVWPSAEALALGITGTPYVPILAALEDSAREEFMRGLRERFAPTSEASLARVMTAVLARASAS